MNVPLTFKYWNYGLRFEDIANGLPLSMEEKPDTEELCRFLCSESSVPFEEVKASPSGVRPSAGPRLVQPAPDASGRLELCPGDVAAELADLAAEEPEQGFAYQLISRRILHAINGAYVEAKETRRRYPVNYAYMNPDDMREAGIEDGARVEIDSKFGSISTLAKGENRLRRGVVSMTHMFEQLVGSGDPASDGGANVGELTSLTEQLQPINFMPRFSGIPVNVRAD